MICWTRNWWIYTAINLLTRRASLVDFLQRFLCLDIWLGNGYFLSNLQFAVVIANQEISFYAETSGKTSTGTQIGKLIVWDFPNQDVSGLASKTYNLVVSASYFFIYITNNGTIDLAPLYVNYGTADQTMDNILIPNNGNKYRTGYYNAFNGTEVRMYQQGSVDMYVYWIEGTHFDLPFTLSQSVDLNNTFKNKINKIAASEDKNTTISNYQQPEPAISIERKFINVENAQTVVSTVRE